MKRHCWNFIKYSGIQENCFHIKKGLGANSIRVICLCFLNCVYITVIVQTQADQLLPQLLIELFDTLPSQCRHIEHMREGDWFIFFDKMTAMRT